MNLYKRIFPIAFGLCCITILNMFFACGNELERGGLTVTADEFSVHFLYVGNGDCTLVHFPDGKNMLIDCGSNEDDVSDYVKDSISSAGGKIDYLVLTHPDSEHNGNAKAIAEEFEIGTAFIPYIKNYSLFPDFYRTIEILENKGVNTEISSFGISVVGEDYFVGFLYPSPPVLSDSAYHDLNLSLEPSDKNVDEISCVIFVEYAGVRFLFMSDSGERAETDVTDNYLVGYYDKLYRRNVNLRDIDFLKVDGHGSPDSSTERFMGVVSPENAVISVGSENYEGLPSTAAISRIINSNPDVNLLRTDVKGTVSVSVGKNGVYSISSESD